MKAIFVLALLWVVSGCTISATNYHLKLEQHSSANYDKSKNVWCFTASQLNAIEVCSSAYRRKSDYIGLGVPIIPQWNRSSRLAYDNRHSKMVQFKNRDTSMVELTELGGILSCAENSSKTCEAVESITLMGNDSVWLKLPEGESHSFTINSGPEKFKAELKTFTESRWHPVSV